MNSPSDLRNGSEQSNGQRPLSQVSMRSVKISSFDITDDSAVNGHVPSYIGISCAISGYSGYSKYNSTNRPSLSLDNSPSSAKFDPKGPMGRQLSLTDSKPPPRPSGRAKSGSSIEVRKRGEITLPVTEEVSETSEVKSIVQQRIESLYGSRAVEGWRDSRSKLRHSTGTTQIKFRSPSCPPPKATSSMDIPKKSAAVFKHVEQSFLERLESNQDGGDFEVKKPSDKMNITQDKVPCEKVKTEFNQVDSKLTAEPVKSDAGAKTGHSFVAELEDTCDAMRRRIVHTQGYIEQDGDKMSEDVLGNLHSAIGKANLLIDSKLRQFRDLCMKNINKSLNDGFETKLEDLEGFWAMVSFQIDEINHIFDDVDLLKKNNWQSRSPDVRQLQQQYPKVDQPKIRSLAARKTISNQKGSPSKKNSTAGDSEAAAAREAARRERLKEAKRKQQALAAKTANQKDDSDQVTIFVSLQDKEDMLKSNS
ncbi:Disks large-associated protein 1 [Halotydeus destructor]|nr:Disks large-associated protein 1 [Halotydeus destructor]